jgi:hypothetical protein
VGWQFILVLFLRSRRRVRAAACRLRPAWLHFIALVCVNLRAGAATANGISLDLYALYMSALEAQALLHGLRRADLLAA